MNPKNILSNICIYSFIVTTLLVPQLSFAEHTDPHQKDSVDYNLFIDMTEEERDWLEANPVIRLAPNSSYAPLDFVDEDGIHQGISGEYIKIITKTLGIDVEVIETDSWKEMYHSVKNDEADFVATAVHNETLDEYLIYSAPYTHMPAGIYSSSPSEDVITLNALSGKKVAMVPGCSIHRYMSTNYPEMEVVEVKSVKAGLLKASSGSVDAFISNIATSNYQIQQQGIPNLHIVGDADFDYHFRLGIRKDWPEFQSLSDKVLQALDQEQKSSIQAQWIQASIHPDLGPGPNHFLFLLIVFLVVSIWFLYHKLHKKYEIIQDLRHTLSFSSEQLHLLVHRENNSYLLERAGIILDSNPAMCQLCQLTESQLQRQPIEIFLRALGISSATYATLKRKAEQYGYHTEQYTEAKHPGIDKISIIKTHANQAPSFLILLH
jgi:ABC-type amino acid transport substrate-binding protein